MRTSVRAVETFPAWRTATPVHALECGGMDRIVRMETLWVVSPLEGRLTWDRTTGEYAVGVPVDARQFAFAHDSNEAEFDAVLQFLQKHLGA